MSLLNTLKYMFLNRKKLKTTEEIIKEISEVMLYSIQLYQNDSKKALDWFYTKNSYFFNYSPFEYILAGNGESVIETLKERLGID